MKKIFTAFVFSMVFLLCSFSASACYGCLNFNPVLAYHYVVPDRHCALYLKYNPETVSAPIYSAYTIYNNKYYLIFRSDNSFTARFGFGTGSSIDCTGSSYQGVDDSRQVFTAALDWITSDMDLSMEFTNVSLRLPNFIPDVNPSSSSAILALDKSLFTLAVNSDGTVFTPEPFDPYNNNYSDDIPAPEIYRDGDKIMFSNSSPDMFLLANVRWYSVDDITLFKESLSWLYRPDSIIHSDLNWLLSVNDLYPSVNGVNLYDLGVQSFQEFLSAYPVDARTYLGGTNALGNYLLGYNDALSTLKMILGQMDSAFNAPELFFRYYVPLADGTYKCGKWTKYSRSLPSGASDGAIDGKWNVQYQVSDAPLTSDDVIGSKPYDTSGMTTYTSKDNTVVVDFDSPDYTISIDNLNQITSLFGQFPSFVSTVFCFLPSWILSLIGCTITLLVGLAVYHALRG